MPESTLSSQVILWIFGVAYTLAQAAMLFMWNNLRADMKEHKEEAQERMDKLEKEIQTKANTKDMDQRRDDIKQLYELIGNVEKTILARVNKFESDILVAIAEMKGTKNATPTRRR